jgi:hypothetical protein
MIPYTLENFIHQKGKKNVFVELQITEHSCDTDKYKIYTLDYGWSAGRQEWSNSSTKQVAGPAMPKNHGNRL